MKCGVPSLTLGHCDDERGHEGEMHGSEGDGFYARCGLCLQPLRAGHWKAAPSGAPAHGLGSVCKPACPKPKEKR